MLSKETVTKLRKVMSYIKEEPRRLDMYNWGLKADMKKTGAVEQLKHDLYGLTAENEPTKHDLPPCGTAACLAGTAVLTLLTKKEQKPFVLKSDIKGYVTFGGEVSYKAAKVLGLTESQRTFLFYPNSWPYSYYSAYNRANDELTARARAKHRYAVTNALVEAFIKADGERTSVEQYDPR